MTTPKTRERERALRALTNTIRSYGDDGWRVGQAICSALRLTGYEHTELFHMPDEQLAQRLENFERKGTWE